MTVASASLSTILPQAERGEWSLVLGGLLQRWRAAPCVAVADVIVAIGERMPAPDAKNWEDIAAKHAPEALSGLLASLLAKGSVKARPRIDLLASGPTDPRIDRWVAARYADPPFTSTGAQPFYTRLAALTARVLDASAAKTILSERETRYPAGTPEARHIDRAKLQRLVDAPLSPAEAEAIAAVAALVAADTPSDPMRSRRGEALLDAVLEAPADDTRRAVLGDYLLEAGHPRGELIALQLEATRRALTRPEAARVRAIIKASRKELLGPLDAAITSDCAFARGFLSRASVRAQMNALAESAFARALGHPLWATVEHLESNEPELITHPVMRSLRSLVGGSKVAPAVLSRLHLDTLVTRIEHARHAEWSKLVATREAFPALRSLSVYTTPSFARELIGSDLGRRLEELTVHLETERSSARAEAFQLFAEVPSATPTVTLHFVNYRSSQVEWGSVFRFARLDERIHVHVTNTAVKVAARERTVADDVLEGLDRIAAMEPRELTVAPRFTPELHARIAHRVEALGGTIAAPERS